MKINSGMYFSDKFYSLEYEDMDDFSSLPLDRCSQVLGVCFVGNEIIIVHSQGAKEWGLPGGTTEKGESIDQTFKREIIIEETNYRVIKWRPIGAQKVTAPDGKFSYQLRVCALVEKIGEFVSDPGGLVCENKLINPFDYKKYFDWKEIGERIINRAVEIKSKI